MKIRCSLGTANVLGLKKVKVDALPTTAYLMVGERCRFECDFCAQARNSSARADLLSRVSWPKFAGDEVLRGLAIPEAQTVLQRICFQVVQDEVALAETKEWVKRVKANSKLPICVSAGVRTLEEVKELLDLGVDHVSIALDAATPEIYMQTKSGSWVQRFTILTKAAEKFPGHMATHLIVGLGESEEEMAHCLQSLYDREMTVALFAFTPIKGTRMGGTKPPEMAHYRRIQVAHDLIRQGLARAEQFYFQNGRVIDFNFSVDELQKTLGGEPFQTSGCKGCNRPYYNETPGRELYNYPRALTSHEVEVAWRYIRQKAISD